MAIPVRLTKRLLQRLLAEEQERNCQLHAEIARLNRVIFEMEEAWRLHIEKEITKP